MTSAVHFGAGSIGRGFIGLLLAEAGYRVIFADVQTELVDAIAAAGRYRVHEVGEGAVDHEVDGVTALESNRDAAALISAIAGADVVTTAVGPGVLPHLAPTIAAGIRARPERARPLVVMACENAIGATDLLRERVASIDPTAAQAARWANTAVDRIVPGQPAAGGLDVTVEHYCEWVIDGGPLGAHTPLIPGATVVADLTPYLERKLFTVNTGHATAAYHGHRVGADTIATAIDRPEVGAELRAVLAETSALLVARHGTDPAEQAAYVERIIRRFRNPALPDTVVRVGREPMRKLGRHERFIAPAAAIAEGGGMPSALLRAIGAALVFRTPDDAQSVELGRLLEELEPTAFVPEVTGIEPGHPLHTPLLDVVAAAR